VGLIYHIAYQADWAAAQRDGEYLTSSRGRTQAEEGFIHASTADQLAGVANAFYAGDDDLLVLVIDEERLRPEVVYEEVPGMTAPFPHIYGPLNVDAVVGTRPLSRGTDGRFTFSRP
jgi:uncharacterized protein (DUF952 family)